MKTKRADKAKIRVHISWMIRRDMPEVLEIETSSFDCPWSADDFFRCLRQRNCIGMVAESNEKVLGFFVYELHEKRLQILNLAVHPEHRRAGVGEQMVAKLVSKLSGDRRTRIGVEVRETNLAAQLFFRAQGFRATRVLRGLFEDTGEDGYLMKYRFAGDEDE